MTTIRLRTPINAPAERCFDIARSIDLHVQSQIRHREEAIAGVTTGLIGMDDDVTWRARHFGVRQTMTVRITRFDRLLMPDIMNLKIAKVSTGFNSLINLFNRQQEEWKPRSKEEAIVATGESPVRLGLVKS